MKKDYLKPETTVMGLQQENLMDFTISGNVKDPSGAGAKEQPSTDEDMADEWGETGFYKPINLWADMDEKDYLGF